MNAVPVSIIAIVAASCFVEAAVSRYQGYRFEAYAVSTSGRRLTEHSVAGRPALYVSEGDEYSIVLCNPLPVRAGVALSIDGLNTINGEHSSPSKARKWILEPNSSITIRGWQTGMSSSRRFVFTNKHDSYAEWKQQQDRQAHTRNLGVIGIAWFWSSDELHRARNPPRPFISGHTEADFGGARKEASAPSAGAAAAPEAKSRSGVAADAETAAARQQERAGTGMGRQERHWVTRVAFEFDTGMYSARDVLAIYYEFARPKPEPEPFLDEAEGAGFTPDMHSRSRPRPWWLRP